MGTFPRGKAPRRLSWRAKRALPSIEHRMPGSSAALTIRIRSLAPNWRDTPLATNLRDFIVHRIYKRMGAAPQPEQAEDDDQDAAVVLVSHSLARWVEDEQFLTGVVASAGFARDPGRIVTVLAAAVHAIPATDARQRKYAPGEGVSILRGSIHRMLESVFPGEPSATGGTVAADPHFGFPALRFDIPPIIRLGQRMNLHVPLANTLFATGHPVAITAGRWKFDGAGGKPRPVGRRILGAPGSAASRVGKKSKEGKAGEGEGESEEGKEPPAIVISRRELGRFSDEPSFLTTRLIPLTPARPVTRSLGNILSKVTVEGKATPPSKELESIIPALIEKRKTAWDVQLGKMRYVKPDSTQLDTKLEVWALIMPPPADPDADVDVPVLETLDLEEHSFEREAALSWGVSDVMPTVLARGGRLFKVLSGGGGWGDKQGLLSLDPNTSLTQTADQTLDNFIASFTATDRASRKNSLPPGSTVQFLTTPHFPMYANPLGRDHKIRPQLSIVFGTDHMQPHQGLTSTSRPRTYRPRGTGSPRADDPANPREYSIDDGAAAVEDYPGRFGAVASPLAVHHAVGPADAKGGNAGEGTEGYGGIYIGLSKLQREEGGEEEGEEGAASFKLDAPGTYVATRSLDRPKKAGESEEEPKDEWQD